MRNKRAYKILESDFALQEKIDKIILDAVRNGKRHFCMLVWTSHEHDAITRAMAVQEIYGNGLYWVDFFGDDFCCELSFKLRE